MADRDGAAGLTIADVERLDTDELGGLCSGLSTVSSEDSQSNFNSQHSDGNLFPPLHSPAQPHRSANGVHHKYLSRRRRPIKVPGTGKMFENNVPKASKQQEKNVPDFTQSHTDDGYACDSSDVDVEDWMGSVSTRVTSLPSMVCSAACGDLYMIPVRHVQECMQKITLGKEGLRDAKRLHNSILRSNLSPRSRHHGLRTIQRNPTSPKSPIVGGNRGSSPGSGIDPGEFDYEIEERLNRTLNLVEKERNLLVQAWRQQRQKEPSRETEETRPASPPDDEAPPKHHIESPKIELPAILSIPDLSSSSDDEQMALPTPSPLKQSQKSTDQWRGVVRKIHNNWNKLAKKKNRMTKIRLGKKFGDVWSTEDIHALWLSENHSRNVHQGTGVYNTKCKELGLTVNTKVLQNLLHAHCDLSGCDLGRKGSQAVASAISSNMVISTLDISKNQIDGKSLGVLVRGILTSIGHAGGFLADGEKQKIKEVKVVSKSKWKKLAEVSTKPAVGFEKLNAAMNKLNDVSARIKASQAQKTGLNGNLHDLILAENPLGFSGALLLSNCLNPARIRREFLTTLDLTKCNIPDQGGKVLAEALGEGNILLNTLKLPHNMIGDGTAKAFARLFEFNHTLLHLDLSWNLIKQDGARALARGLQSNATLQQLNLAWNGIESKGVMFMGEMLQVNLGLKHLDMSSTRAGPDSCLVIAEGLKMNNVLEVLLLDNNPVGEGGARHLMLAMGCNASIKYLGLQSSITANASPQSDSQLNIASNFDISSPDNHYVLNLSVPAERAVALQLCQMDQRSSSNLMRNIKHGDTSVESAKKAGWPDRLPDSGRLVADFVTTMDPVHIKVFTEKQLLPLLPQFSKKMMLDTDKLGLTSMVCPHYYFKCDQIAKILVNFGMGDAKVFAAAAFMSRAVDVEENKKMIYDCLSDRDLHQLSRELGFYKHFTPHNPTGHYEFILTELPHQYIINRIKDIAREQAPGATIRNLIHDHLNSTKLPICQGAPPLLRGGPPPLGTLSLDFVSSVHVPHDAEPMSAQDWNKVLQKLVGLLRPSEAKTWIQGHGYIQIEAICHLREKAWNLFVTTAQVIETIAKFQASPDRVEVAVILFRRTVDKENWWQAMYEMNCLEQACLMNRLGPDNIFDLKHASIHFVLDFTNSTHEETAKKLVQYAQQETELPNFWNFKLMGKKKQVQENSNMWALLTTENSAPLLEFDFIGGDGFELLGKTPEDMKNMSHGERLDVRSRQGKKQELLRLQQTFSYWVESGEDLDTYDPPEWATRDVLYKPLPDKAPWVAGWDRFIRKLIRMEEANGVEDENPLCDLFDEFAKMEGRMTLEELQDLLTTTLGFSKQDQGQIQRIFHEKATNTADRTKKVLSGAALRAKDAHKTNQPTVTHKAFLQIFMQELPKLIRSKAKTPVDGTAET